MSYYDSPPDDPGKVSPCCGADYEEITNEATEYICDKCKESFDYPEEEYEYDDRMREHWADIKMDEERLKD